MGVSSGVKWSRVNLGAKQPTQTVNYCWGETWTKDFFFYTSYHWFGGFGFGITKYCTDPQKGYNGFTDGKTTLDAQDDPVQQVLGNGWRLPTHKDWEELRDTDKFEWSPATVNGVNGWTVYSKVNWNWLFFPKEGGMAGAGGQTGHIYWCNLLSPNDPQEAACTILTEQYGLISDHNHFAYANRFDPGSIRPVRD